MGRRGRIHHVLRLGSTHRGYTLHEDVMNVARLFLQGNEVSLIILTPL